MLAPSQVAMPHFPLRAIQVMPVSRQPVFEILNMRKVDEAFSDGLKAPLVEIENLYAMKHGSL
jgi:hypothetical protein